MGKACQGRGKAGGIHLVDKCLMVFMAVLLVHSAYSLFFPGKSGADGGGIDVMVRTSSASIFGYFLSGNFRRRPGALPEERTGGGAAEAAPAAEQGGVPRGRIGFQPPGAEGEALAALPPRLRPEGGRDGPCRLQVLTAAAIGLFCLVALLLLRERGVPEDDSATATVAQFRDFVSGCVGFLIGCPTRGTGEA